MKKVLNLILVLAMAIAALTFVACDGDDDEIKSCTMKMTEYDISICMNTNNEDGCKSENGVTSMDECATTSTCAIDGANYNAEGNVYLSGADLTEELCTLMSGEMQ